MRHGLALHTSPSAPRGAPPRKARIVMKNYSLEHLSNSVLLRETNEIVERDRLTTAELIAHLAEVDARKLYLEAAFPSMHAWCVRKLGMSEDAASKRIQAARVARAFPAIFSGLADGRLHLSAVCLLAPVLQAGNAEALLAAAAGKTKSEIELLIAERFPRTEMLPLVEMLTDPHGETGAAYAPGHTRGADPRDDEHAPGHVQGVRTSTKPTPIASHRFAIHITIGQDAYADLTYAQELLSHQIPNGDVAEVFKRALKALIREAEKRKFAATDRPHRVRRQSQDPRHVPAHVQREVWERDGGQCTFVSEEGHRCEARTLIEYDHVEEVARGGSATVPGIRLRCRAHNQFTAEQTFGREFMENKREAARRAAVAARAKTEAHEAATMLKEVAARSEAEALGKHRARAVAAAAERAREQDVVPWLRALGIRADEANRVAGLCEAFPDAPLNERVRYAFSCVDTKARLRPPAA